MIICLFSDCSRESDEEEEVDENEKSAVSEANVSAGADVAEDTVAEASASPTPAVNESDVSDVCSSVSSLKTS